MCWLHLKQKQWLPPHSQSRWLILFKCTAITPALRKRLGGGGHCTAESGLKKQKDSSSALQLLPNFFSFRHLETNPDSSPMHFYTEQYGYINNDSNNHTFTHEKTQKVGDYIYTSTGLQRLTALWSDKRISGGLGSQVRTHSTHAQTYSSLCSVGDTRGHQKIGGTPSNDENHVTWTLLDPCALADAESIISV